MFFTIVLDIFILLLGLGTGMAIQAMLSKLRRLGRFPDARVEHLERELREARGESRLMETIARHASDGLLIQDITGRVQWSNPAYSRMTGYSAEEIRGRKPQEFLLPEEDRLSPDELRNFRYDISSGVLDGFELVRNQRKNGELFWNQLGFAVVARDEDNEPRIIVMARDVTEQIEREAALKKATKALQLQAETDVLTRLPNRMKLNRFLHEVLERAEHGEGEVGIVHVDLDRFKEVNDTLGHAAGDAVLVHAAKVMTARMRRLDLVCRFGGDEFIIACPGIESYADLEGIIERISNDLHEPIEWDSHKIQIGASIGVSISAPGNRQTEDLMRQADLALYEVKNSGRDGIRLFTPELKDLVSQRNALSAELARAIPDNQLDIALQPQFNLNTRKVVAFEALIRWRHSTRGVLVPAHFLDVAKNSGQMQEIDSIAVSHGLRALAKLHAAGHAGLRISLNISGHSLWMNSFIDMVKWEVENNGLSPHDVCIEVAESFFFGSDEQHAAEIISSLSDAGFSVMLDNFGTGHSGLGNLAQLNIEGVKIDRSLIRDGLRDRTNLTVVKSVYALCRDLGLSVIAEGVESAHQATQLQKLGASVVQGNAIAVPMPLEQALDWIDNVPEKALPFAGQAPARQTG